MIEKHEFNPDCPCCYCSSMRHEDRLKQQHRDTCRCAMCDMARTEKVHPKDCQCPECHSRRVKNDTCADKDCEYRAPNTLTKLREQSEQTVLVCFESGHYKKLTGKWKGDTIWTHWIKPDGKGVHINKDKVEYYEEL